MINLLEQLNQDKNNTLAKKSEDLGVPQPTQQPLAKSLNLPQKSTEMAASPQAKTSAQQKSLRSAQVKEQAPREVEEADSFRSRAQEMIGNLANFNQQNVEQQQMADIEALKLGRPDLTDEQALQMLQSGQTDVTADMSGLGDTSALVVKVAELGDEDMNSYVRSLGYDPAVMGVEELREIVEKETQEITSIVDNSRAILNDPNQPSNVRRAAAQDMIDYGAAHLIATDAQLEDFENDIRNVGIVEIDGKEFTLEEVGDNPAIAATLHSAAEQIMANEMLTAEDLGLPEPMFAFVQKHAESIMSTLDADKATFGRVKETVTKNKQAMETVGEDLSKVLGLNEFTTEDISQSPGIKALTDDNQLLAQVGYEGNTVREELSFLGKLAPEKVKKWAESGSFTELSGLVEMAQDLKTIQSIPSNPALLKKVVGVDYNRLSSLVQDAARNPDKYSTKELQMVKMFDPEGTGQVGPQSLARLSNAILEGKDLPNFSELKTLEERQTKAITDIVQGADISRFDLNTFGGKNSAMSSINKAISRLKELDENHPLIKAQIKELLRAKGRIADKTTGTIKWKEKEPEAAPSEEKDDKRFTTVGGRMKTGLENPEKAFDTSVRGGVKTVRKWL